VCIVGTRTSWAAGKILRTAGGDGDTDPFLRRDTTYHYYVAVPSPGTAKINRLRPAAGLAG
jgi:hypothetical protein